MLSICIKECETPFEFRRRRAEKIEPFELRVALTAKRGSIRSEVLRMYRVGCKILMFTGIVFIVLGIYSVLFNNTSLFSIINWIMDPNFWGNEELSEGTLRFKIFTWDFLGMFHIIWGVNILYVVKHGLLKRKESWAWKSLFISVMTLILVDIHFTLTIQRNSFIAVTVFFSALFFIPLFMTREVLKKTPTNQ